MILRSLALFFIVSAFGLAQTVNFGVQGQLTIPGGDLKQGNSEGALGLGAQVRWGLSRGHAVVLKADRTVFNGTRTFEYYGPYSYDLVTVDSKQTVLSLGVDYNYYFSRKVGEGFYLGGGLGFLQKDEAYKVPAGYASPDQTKTRLYFDFNLGVAVNRHVNLFLRTMLFGDERQEDTYYTDNGENRTNYSLSTTFAFGAEFHF